MATDIGKPIRVCVVMGDDRPVLTGDAARGSYPSLAYEINRRFCAARGWDFRYEQYRLPSRPWRKLDAYSASARQHRAASWVKILAVLRALELGYDLVLWIDSDCVFYADDADWSGFLDLFRREDLHLAAWVDRPFHADRLCAGFFAVRNGPQVREMLQTVWGRPSATSVRHSYEQEEFARYLRHQPASWHHLVDEPMFRLEGRGQRLLHLASHDHALRIPEFLRWFEERGLPPHPQAVETHVHTDLDVDAADLKVSGRAPGFLEKAWREVWSFVQIARGWVRRIRFG